MAQVGEPLGKDKEFTSPLTTHGCGENFPLDESGENLDTQAEDGKEDAVDRRVEFFFFDAEYGIVPSATSKNSKPGSAEYPKWREGAKPKFDFETPESGMRVLKLRLHNRLWVPIDQQSETGTDASTQEVPYRVTIGTVQRPEKKAPGGRAQVIVPELCVDPVLVEWGELDANGEYPFERRIFADCATGTARQRAHAQLSNLGYRFKIADDGEYALAVQQFQTDYGITEERGLVNRQLGKKTGQLLSQIYATGIATPPIFQTQAGGTNGGAQEDPIAPFTDDDPFVPDLSLQATGFVDGGAIDLAQAGLSYGANKAPELKWDAGPANTQSFAVFMCDPGADCVHWVVVDIPGTAKGLNPPASGTSCQNYLNQTYAGPNPPKGEVHQYVLRVVALDKTGILPTNRAIKLSEFDTLIQGHVLGESRITSQFPKSS